MCGLTNEIVISSHFNWPNFHPAIPKEVSWGVRGFSGALGHLIRTTLVFSNSILVRW